MVNSSNSNPDRQTTSQTYKYSINIENTKDIHIGDIYQRYDEDAIAVKSSFDLIAWQNDRNRHFSESLTSITKSHAAFKQQIDFKSEGVKFIHRQPLFDRLDDWYSSWHEHHNMLAITGEEGDGKTWGAAYWLEQKIQVVDAFPAVIFLPSSSVVDRDPENLICEIIAKASHIPIDRCKKYIGEWIDRSTPHPPILLVLDGINERREFSWWRELINALMVSPWCERLAVLITCRQKYWSSAPAYLQELTYHLPPYSETELTEALKKYDLNRSKFSEELLPLLSKPRYFDLMVKYRDRMADSGNITIPRLIYEDWKDRWERKTDLPLDNNEFQGFIRELATKQLEHLKISKTEIDRIIPSIDRKLELLNEIQTSGIIREKRGAFEVDENYLVHGLALLLVDELDAAVKSRETPLSETIARWIEPRSVESLKPASAGRLCVCGYSNRAELGGSSRLR